MMDHRASLANAEKKFGFKAGPAVLRVMASEAREEARQHEDAAARAHNRADVYEDLATEREAGA